MSAYHQLLDALTTHTGGVQRHGDNKATARCPAHDDRQASLSITAGRDRALVYCHAGCATEDVLAALGWTLADLYDAKGQTYRYDDGRTVRRSYDKDGRKTFRQSGHQADQPPTLYRLAEVRAAVDRGEVVYLVEGEEDVHALELLDVVATTAPMGATNVGKADLTPLHGAHVIAVADNDEPGTRWAGIVASELAGAAASLRFAHAATGKDAADHVAAGHALKDLVQWEPPTDAVAPEPDDAGTYTRLISGSAFVLDRPATPEPLWGQGDSVLWADLDPLMIAGPQGTGKTTLGQQLTLGVCGFTTYAELLGQPVKRDPRGVLYLAMDRPAQAARSLRRMVTEEMRDRLDQTLTVWEGPPPFDLAKHPSVLLDMARKSGRGTVVVDSTKDAFIGVSKDEEAAGYNRARQMLVANGINIVELHHQRKQDAATRKSKDHRPGIDDIYGSTWLTSGAGSVILLGGQPGDPIVSLWHVKQPVEEVGPFKLLHDGPTGRTTIWHEVDAVAMARQRPGGISATDLARVMFEKDRPTPAEKAKARRKLESLATSGHLELVWPGDAKTNTPARWGATCAA